MLALAVLIGLTCPPGERPLDLRGKLPTGHQTFDLVISVEPYYARVYISQLGFPASSQQCCSGKPTSVLRVPIAGAQFCLRQSQPQMKWKIQVLLNPELEL